MPKRLPRVLVIAFFLLFVGVVIQRLFVSNADKPEAAAVIAVEAAAVRQLDMNDYRYFNGTLRPNAQFLITPKVGGILLKLTVGVGDQVEKGQLIAELEDDEIAQEVIRIRAQLTVAKAQLSEATASAQVAERDFQRTKQLLDRKIASEAEYDGALTRVTASRARLSVAKAQLQQAQAALKAAELKLSYTKIYADWPDEDTTRVVGQRFVDEGALLRPSEPVVQVLAFQPIIAQMSVTERDYSRLTIGQPVTLTTAAYPDQEFTGVISRISPQFNEMSRQALLEVTIPNESGDLKPGMFGRARILFDQAPNAIAVSNDALVERQGKMGVFRVEQTEDGAIARFVPVETGLQDGDLTQIVSPPLQGQVVTLGLHLLDDGKGVEVSRVREP
ncbi:efflux RND transporter periplasmic adaptor subunit [Candidatus Macondimonas diazotrophica]|jgi:RND family efflux transporter MFP subunit|uniref:Efflux RND transporter periplasmic adaptor subunit n=1 Tax=Candidatus Macondimonas diazotrophica TaxID=2305248 RepID=A0A4Z0FCF5_9GAMM|nr:efflux RND transporter periplasmic adaptor subunit [Candidatus Macondimonas diazotrophica]NCU00665.1 efflux RND transporter periplasmic adaptor subunit [Candidatus Macondimonas diazotrophica]TFZ83541.1 efflux RND transporter periplasmic adaptor subunit [Candidatus Macondimonas diazotrophica]HBG50614.1 efflux RND transporter periplasmic adaptor subunit [Gammaproteobacteria bacterium]